MSAQPYSSANLPRKQFAVTPHDTNDLAIVPLALWIGSGGDLTLILADDTVAQTLKNVPDGTLVEGRVKRVLATGTGCLNIVGQY